MKEYANRQDVFDDALAQHLTLLFGSVLPALVVGVPLGVWCYFSTARQGAIFSLLNVIQTVPSVALFGLLIAPLAGLVAAFPWLGTLGIAGTGMTPALIALALYALLPLVRGVVVGLNQIPRDVLESASAMGMSEGQRFLCVQLPLALPVFLRSLRVVMVQTVGMAVVAALIGAGGFGALVFQGLLSSAAELDFKEEAGSGDGYAKVMSDAFIKAEMALFAAQAKEVDIIVTTALIPGKPAPTLITREMVDTMKSGSVIVDLAAQNGGNCEYTVPGEIFTTENGVKVIGYTDLPGRLPTQSSQLYGTNLVNLLKLLCKEKDGNINVDFDDVVIRGVTVIRDGEITWPAPPIQVSAQPQAAQKAAPEAKAEEKCTCSPWRKYALMALAIILFGWLASVAPKEFLGHFTVFALACVVGYYVVWNVSHALHTPLMSVTNAISGIIVVGALLQIGQGGWVSFLSFIAVLIASINIFGGFTVTQRMLKMFRKN